METFDCEQGSKEWFDLRIGSIGGSSIGAVCAKGEGKSRKSLLYRFAGEILSGEKYEGYQNHHMERGIALEPEAKRLYAFKTGRDVVNVGLKRLEPHKHCSPDGMIEPDGTIEVKCVIPSVHIETIDSDKVPAAYVKQVQWNLFITKSTWCDFVSYSPTVLDIPIWIITVERNEKLIKQMNEEADRFIEDLKVLVEKIKSK